MESSSPEPLDLTHTYRHYLPRAVLALEDAVHELICSGWSEPERVHAYDLARTLGAGSSAFGRTDVAGISRALSSLLALPCEDVIPVEAALRRKLKELLSLLKETLEEGQRETA